MDENNPMKKPTSKVIDSLHSQIDSLKNELDSIKISHDDYKKKYSIIAKKNDSFVDQLANAKHENDMINALLKRKERRITDLEDQYNELCSTNESLNLNNKNMKIRCENLQESSASSTAEFERLKIAYDALIASQVEYKKHYQKELNQLTVNFEDYKKQNLANFETLSNKLLSNDKDVDTLLDSLTNKRKTMDNLYVNKNKSILELLTKLAKTAKIHGQESKIILSNNVDIINQLKLKIPDLEIKIANHENIEIDLDEILNDTNETLSNSSFDEEATLISSPDPQKDDSNSNTPKQSQPIQSLSRNNTMSSKRRKNKRNSIRFDSSKSSNPDFSSINTPTQLNIPKRNSINLNSPNTTPRNSSFNQSFDSRTPTPPEEMHKYPNYNNNYNNNNYNNNNNFNNVGKVHNNLNHLL
ncbi:hypothetical protein HYPBUDRAFT_156241 [Hyphopichia burtonii NRRL Y-1933]|uniref:SWI5-dependent HO expression protein 3 n=1 Tax=Hyphopichia burtonii NRRL Y-1933 TaxID=984485 RepID=A0A1E4RJM6_9ASCO|nr:hypothetical protein HYPBUDRAFT_156241 [Hyphopichia burtonii NRRL Y-1933]ODV67436.1 hypothetical protein HYPBUDRAFT_156241 [Hyphopichia burtonii NRRL Y-1933]